MKELSTEQKAKAYYKVREKIALRFGSNVAEEIFSEFEESEDEKIKKWIRKELESKYVVDNIVNNVMADKALAWLEKQGEKPQKTSIWKHWKNGIAGNGEGELIYLIKVGNTYSLSSCLGFECDYIELSELDKLLLEKQGEQKHVEWSEEDEKIKNDFLSFLQDNETKFIKDNGIIPSWSKYITWFSLKYRYLPQLKQEWSEEDERIMKIIKDCLKKYNQGIILGTLCAADYADCIAWLEKQVEQKPVEWSEEDEYNVAFIVELLFGIEDSDKEYKNKCRKMANWLKGLKNRVQPQSKQE